MRIQLAPATSPLQFGLDRRIQQDDNLLSSIAGIPNGGLVNGFQKIVWDGRADYCGISLPFVLPRFVFS